MARRIRKTKKKVNIKYLKYTIIVLTSLFLLFVLTKRLVLLVKNLQIFKVKEIVLAPSLQHIRSSYLMNQKGKSIFDVNLKKIQYRIESKYSDIDQLKIIRQFPDRLYVYAKKREPFASIVSNDQNIIIDKRGIVLSLNNSSNIQIPMIYGIQINKKVILGNALRIREIGTALEIIHYMQINSNLKRYEPITIDMSNTSKIYIKFKNKMKVIIDQDKISQKVKKLAILLVEGNIDLKDYSYIDLRFKEPILGKNE